MLVSTWLTTGATFSQAQPTQPQATTAPQAQTTSTQGFPSIVYITSGNTMHELPLKAVNFNGQVGKVPGFKMDMANVVLIRPNSTLTASSPDSSLVITGAKLRSGTQGTQGFDLQGTGNTYSLAGFAQGVYTLDAIGQRGINNQGAYEAILVIGPAITPQVQYVVQQRIVQETSGDGNGGNDFEKPDDKDTICLYYPESSLCNPDADGNCPDDWGKNEDGQCFPINKDCPNGYERADDDESGACVSKKGALPNMAELPPCDGSLQDCVTGSGVVCEAGSTEHECELDDEEVLPDVVGGPIAGAEGGEVDGGEVDGGEVDGGEVDGGEVDGGEVDGGEVDGGEVDGGEVDGGEVDGGEVDGAQE